jgi:hypothetical protein
MDEHGDHQEDALILRKASVQSGLPSEPRIVQRTNVVGASNGDSDAINAA